MKPGVLLLVWFSLVSLASAAEVPPADFFVAPSGNDAQTGSADQPFATLARARDAVRQQIAAGLKSPVTVLVRGGMYELPDTLVFGPQDSGTEQFEVTYAAYPGEKVVISGGRQVGPWTKGEDEIWTTEVAEVKQGKWHPRLLVVNGRRAVRARTPNIDAEPNAVQMTGATLSPDLKQYTITLPAGLAKNWKNIGDVELMSAGNWEINRKRVQSVDVDSGTLVLAPPHSAGHDAIRPGPGRWCHLENAREMLDEPGEWYLDRSTGVLSYWPRPGDDMATAEASLGRLTRLVEIRGTNEQPVRNLHFKGLTFAHSNWPLPEGGYMGIQACHFNTGGSWHEPWGRIPAAICLEHAQTCSIEDGELAHLDGCGIEMVTRCRNNLVQGNRIWDIGGNGISVGGPKSEEDVPQDNRLANNHIEGCGREYYGAVGIWAGLTQRTVISHNLVHGLPYSGISIGWQWNPEPTACKENTVEYNHVYDVMNRLCDGGCIYTLGLQPGTVIRGNHLHDSRRSFFAQGAPNNGMFIDEGSKGFLFEKNVIYNTSAELVRFNQCRKEWHEWRDNHFGEEVEVKRLGAETIAAAGLEPAYRERLQSSRMTEVAARNLMRTVDPDRISKHVFFLAKDPLPYRKLNFTLPGHEKSTLHEADDYLAGQFESCGYRVDREAVRVQAFRRDPNKPKKHQYSPPKPEDPWYDAFNIYAEKKGRLHPDEIIVVVAHKDSQSWVDSPGANDNAIGTAGVLELARALATHPTDRTVRFLLCNEEHIPWTSVTAAQNAKARGDNIIAVFNLDGIGVKTAEDTAAGKKTNVTAWTEPEGERLAQLMAQVNARYAIGLEQRAEKRPSPGDDDGSFVKAGYPAAVVNIGSWPYGDPNYHGEGDIPELCDFANAAMTVQATLAAILTLDDRQ